jgi:DNA-binding NarL/FixJ family response regulator
MDRDPAHVNITHAILVVDDHDVVRKGVISTLLAIGCNNIAEASSYSQALQISHERGFALTIIDFNLGGANGIDCALGLSMIQPEMLFILLSIEEDWQIVRAAERAGFQSFISKSAPLSDLTDSVLRALSTPGGFHFSMPKVIAAPDSERLSFLTHSEIDVLTHLRKGLTTREIAQYRFCSEATVKSHLTAIYRKFGVKNRTGAIAAMEGLLKS